VVTRLAAGYEVRGLYVISVKATPNKGQSVLAHCTLCDAVFHAPAHAIRAGLRPCNCPPRRTIEEVRKLSKNYDLLQLVEEAPGEERTFLVRCRRCGAKHERKERTIVHSAKGGCMLCHNRTHVLDGRPSGLKEVAARYGVAPKTVEREMRRSGSTAEEAARVVQGKYRQPHPWKVGDIAGNRSLTRLRVGRRGGKVYCHEWACRDCGALVVCPPNEARSRDCSKCRSGALSVGGVKLSYNAAAALYGTSGAAIKRRLQRNYSLPQALGLHPPPKKDK
jgi:hypothetical protein